MIVTPLLAAPSAILLVRRHERIRHKMRTGAVEELRKAREGDEGYKDLLKRTFRLFDKNQSGFIEDGELRILLEAIHPDIKRKHMTMAMVEVRRIFFTGNRISLVNFLDSLEDIRELVTVAS